ncbi:MAG: Polar-differentiation response regulator DivK [Planctomycetota bacterium]|jgi:excisionase family DNA binding protein
MAFDKEVLTTGEVAKICNVAPRTVSKWFDTGALRGYRIPGSRDRRIPSNELMKFMRAHGIPLEGMTSGRTRVLIVDGEKDVVETLNRILTEQTSYEIHTATTAFQAGMECEKFKPHVVLLDIHLSDADAKAFAENVRRNEQLQFTKIVAMSGKVTDGQAQTLRLSGFDDFLRKPFQVRDVVEKIEAVSRVAA